MTLQEYAKRALQRGARCLDCCAPLKQEDICHYDHTDGWKVDGFPELQWLYFECGCGYQTSFAKLGFKRPVPS